MARQNKRRRGHRKAGGANTTTATTATAAMASGIRASGRMPGPSQAARANGQAQSAANASRQLEAPAAPGTPRGSAQSGATTLEGMLHEIGAETELIERDVFDGTRQVVTHLRPRPSAVHNVNQEAHDRMSLLDRMALFITERVGTFGFFLIILGWTVFWLLWNSLAPRGVRFDPGPAFVFWLFISNMIQIFLMPLLMVGQNLQGRHNELRAQADFDVNTKAEQEVEAILLHLENQAAQIQRQGELMLQILQHLEALHSTANAPTGALRVEGANTAPVAVGQARQDGAAG